MVYEDFYNGEEGDYDRTLSDIFSKDSRFKDDPKYRKNRLRVNYTEYDELSNWEFLRKSGNNSDPDKNNGEEKDNSSSWIVKKLISEVKNPDFLAEAIKKIPLLPLVYQLGDNSLSIAKHMSINSLSYFLLDKCQDKIHNMLDKISREADKFLEEDLGTKIATGIPSEQFDEAEEFYENIIELDLNYQNYSSMC